jgi:SulP family sulfate permease
MIGQSVINVKSGGRGRLSTLQRRYLPAADGGVPGRLGGQIPMAALVAVMIMVSIGTFNWASMRDLRQHPKSSSTVMLVDRRRDRGHPRPRPGRAVGVLLSGFFFAHKVGQVLYVGSMVRGRRPHAHLPRLRPGVLCLRRCASSAPSTKEVIDHVRIDVSRAHFWDITAVSALDKVVMKFRREGTRRR